MSNFEALGAFKKSGNSPRNWKTYRKQAEETKEAWDKTLKNLESKIVTRADELKRDTTNSRHRFQDNEFFMNKAWGEFSALAMESIEDIFKLYNIKELAEEKDLSKTKEKRFIVADKQIRNEKEEAEKIIQTLVPKFYSFNEGKRQDILDGMFNDIKKGAVFLGR